MKRTSSLHRQKRLVSVGRIRKRNAKRRAKEFARAYGSKKRVKFVQSLPCLVDGCNRYPLARMVAHIETGGMGRKADANLTVPLCFHHHIEVLHRIGRESFEAKYGIDLQQLAADTESRWQAYLNTQENQQ